VERQLGDRAEPYAAARGEQELRDLERPERVGEGGALLLRERGERARRERAAANRRVLDQPTLERGKRVEPRREDALDRVRQLKVLALLRETLHHFLREQRVALGALGDQRHGGVAARRGEQCA